MTPVVNVSLADLPCSIKAYTVVSPDGTYNIIPQADPERPGTGAAGGLGFAFLTFTNSADLVKFFAHG